MKSVLNIEAVITASEGRGLNAGEVDAILQAGWQAVAVDGKLSAEEADAFARAAGKLGGKAMTQKRLDDLLDRFAQDRKAMEEPELLLAIAAKMPRHEARQLAFKVAYALTLCDLDTNDDEQLFNEEMRDALALTEEEGERLAEEVLAAVDPGGETS